MIEVFTLIKSNPRLYVVVPKEFFSFIEYKIILFFGSLKNCSLLFPEISFQTFLWPFKTKNGFHLQRLLRLAPFLFLSEYFIKQQIQGYYYWGSHSCPLKLPKIISCSSDLVRLFSLYLAEGDTGRSGKKKSRRLRFTNTCLSTIQYFTSVLITVFPFSSSYILKIIPASINSAEQSENSYVVCTGFYNKKIKYRVCMDSALVIDILLALEPFVKQLCFTDEELAIAYLQGLMAGEGTIYCGKSAYARIEMKSVSEIHYASKLFSLCSVNTTYYERKDRPGMVGLYIPKKELSYFSRIGFYPQLARQKRLAEIVTSQ